MSTEWHKDKGADEGWLALAQRCGIPIWRSYTRCTGPYDTYAMPPVMHTQLVRASHIAECSQQQRVRIHEV